MLDKSKFKNKKEWRKFAFGLCFGFLIIGTVQLIKSNEYFYLFYAFIPLILLLGLLIPVIFKPIYIVFSYMMYGLSYLISLIILLFLYYFIFTPLSIIKRYSKDQTIKVKFNNEQNTYWDDCHINNEDRKKGYEYQY